MAGKTNIEDCLLQDKNNVREDMMVEGLFAVQGRRCKCYIM